MSNGSYLQRQVGSHGVDRVGEILPSTTDTQHGSTTTKLAFGSDFLGDARYLEREGSQRFHHVVDGQLEVQELAANLDVDGLAEITACDSCGDSTIDRTCVVKLLAIMLTRSVKTCH